MAARNVQGGHFTLCKIVGFLRCRYAGCGFEGNPEDYVATVADAAVHAAGSVLDGLGPAFTGRLEGVIMLRSLHPGGTETVAELYSPYAGDGKDCMADYRLHAVEKRLSKAGRH